MDLKKSLFGGYKKDSVDAFIKQMAENEEQAQAKIALLDNEFRLSKESAQKNLESIQTELVIKQKSLMDLTRTMDEKNSRIAELESKLRTINADFEEQYHAAISEREEKYKAKVAQLTEDYTARISDLEGKYQQSAKFTQQKDDQIKKIGQLYVDAQEYTEKMKMETKAKVLESIDHVFEELNKTQEQFEASFGQINQKKKNLKQLTGEILENLRIMQNKVDSMDYEQAGISTSLDNIKTAKDQIKLRIQDEFDREKSKDSERTYQEPEIIAKEPSYEEIPANPIYKQRTEQAETRNDYSAQIEELKQRLERQEELLQSRNRFSDTLSDATKDTAKEAAPYSAPGFTETPNYAAKPDFSEIHNFSVKPDFTEIPMYAAKPDFAEMPAQTAKSDSEDDAETRIRNEKELSERENYSKYFEEIGKKYSKEQPASYGAAPSADLPDTPAEPEPAEIKKAEPEDADNAISKKPSIKDILNKYANMK